MASLTTHLRVADLLLDLVSETNFVHFIMGNIAPDCGGMPQITHWTPTGEKDAIRSQDFFDAYVKNELAEDKKAFYLGYYVHLLADIAWWNYVWIPASAKFSREIEQDRGFIKIIKKDWEAIDCLFKRDSKDCTAFKILEKINSFPNVYLDYYPENMIVNIANVFQCFDKNADKCNSYISYAEVSGIIEKIAFEIRDNCRLRL